jgi:hypothetical protein
MTKLRPLFSQDTTPVREVNSPGPGGTPGKPEDPQSKRRQAASESLPAQRNTQTQEVSEHEDETVA